TTGWIKRRILHRWGLRIRLTLRGTELTLTEFVWKLKGHRESPGFLVGGADPLSAVALFRPHHEMSRQGMP
ncbi:MAG TPA: hypothetical protein VJM82_03930, partial [Nitrospiraceae bacterium]|nr:hypothetical protein [Nitrospiraceae bacterium]